MKRKKDDLTPLALALLGGSGALAVYLFLRPAPATPEERPMVPTVDPRFGPIPVANLLRSPVGR